MTALRSAGVTAVVLAAGDGTRMRSPLPKVLHRVDGLPMVHHVLDAVRGVQPPPEPTVIVVGRGAGVVQAAIDRRERALGAAPPRFVMQEERRGTGHALLQATEAAAGHSATVLVANGDVPLLRTATLQRLVDTRAAKNAAVAVLTAVVAAPEGYGRVVRAGGTGGDVLRIVEHAAATPEERALPEVNAGVYAFDDDWLWPALLALEPSSSGEVYITDLVARAVADGERVVAVQAVDPDEICGVNSPTELSRAETLMRRRAATPGSTAGRGASGRQGRSAGDGNDRAGGGGRSPVPPPLPTPDGKGATRERPTP